MGISLRRALLFFTLGWMVFFTVRARAMPPFVYQSALNWLESTVRTNVPVAERIYILGPDRTNEYYGLNEGISTHELETRLSVSCRDYKTIAQLLADLPYKHGELNVLIWRAGHQKNGTDAPIFSASMADALALNFALQAQDIIELVPVTKGPVLTL